MKPMSKNDENPYEIEVEANAFFIEEESEPEDDRYVFAYTVTIRNIGQVAAKLLTRHWIITDGNGDKQEVRGEGVVGNQPHLAPGEGFQYSSWAMLDTPIGSMHGSYQMITDDGVEFEADIPAFKLAVPHTLH